MSDDEREEKELDLTSPEVVTKYKSAAEIVNSKFSSSFRVALCTYTVHYVLLCIFVIMCVK